MTVGARPEQGEPQIGSMVGGGDGERERAPGGQGGAFHGAGQDVKVVSLSIRSAGPLAWVGWGAFVFLKEWYHEMLSRHLSVSLFLRLSVGGSTPLRLNQGANFERMQVHNLCDLEMCVLMLNTFLAPYKVWLHGHVFKFVNDILKIV